MSEAEIRSGELAAALGLAAGLAELISRLGGEITALVQEVHAASSPTAALGVDVVGRGVYGGIRSAFEGARRAAVLGGRVARGEPRPDAWLDVRSALNGAFGHLFEESSSAFALPMSLVRREPPRGGAARLVLFLHGLCMNERGWRGAEHARFCEWAGRRLRARVAYLRYNTGLRISENGARLAALLEREVAEPELILVGHSMGGLLARSALHQAEEAGYAWPRRVNRLACLGSPHEGATLERIGNHANRLLGVTPWSRPFMRLGNLRSDGIRDLRFGHLVESDWRDRSPDDPRGTLSRVALASHVEHLHVAASRAEARPGRPPGDWLVSVESALAHNLHPEDGVKRALLRGLGHLDLLEDARVYRLLRSWLEPGPTPQPSSRFA
jgi:pimeloyl-ACP methyl ester carboxylesterase